MKIKMALMGIFSLLILASCTQVATQQLSNQPITGEATPTQLSTDQTTDTMQTTTEQNATQESAQTQKTTGDKIVTLDTDYGVIKFKLYTKDAPEMSKNFEELARTGKYNNVPFHRVIKDFMIQSGDFTNKDGTGGYSYKGPGTKLDDEINPKLRHVYGTVSMANAGPDTNGSQFFIITTHQNLSFMDGLYSIFGEVTQGMDVAEKIADLYIPSSGQSGTPSEIVYIKKATVSLE